MKLEVGDRIRIVSLPDVKYIHADTLKIFKRLLKRGRSVRISRVDEDGRAWYTVRFGKEWHHLLVAEDNWVKVIKRV